MRQRHVRGFTLVELLVVIAIVVVLAAIIVPALNRAREMGKRTVCLSNIRQLTMAWLMYANDNRGRICCAHATPISWQNGVSPVLTSWGWVGLDPTYSGRAVTGGKLWTYLRDKRVYVCPDDPQAVHWNLAGGETGEVLGSPTLLYGPTGLSYCANALLGAQTILNGQSFEPAAMSQPVPIIYCVSQVKNAERMFVFIETTQNFPGERTLVASPAVGLFPPPIYPLGFGSGNVFARPGLFHRSGRAADGCTVSFADGHAIFWQYSNSQVSQWADGLPGPDVWQLAAWGGGPPPPGVTP